MKNISVIFTVDNQRDMLRTLSNFLNDMKKAKLIFYEDKFSFESGQELLSALKRKFLVKDKSGNYTSKKEEIAGCLVLCDVEMPGMDGLDIVKYCRRHPLLRYLNFLMLSDNPTLGVIAQLGEGGVTNVVCKENLSYQIFEKGMIEALSLLGNESELLYLEVEQMLDESKPREALEKITSAQVKSSGPRWIVLKGRILLSAGNIDSAEKHFLAVAGFGTSMEEETLYHIPIILARKFLLEIYEQRGQKEKLIENLEELRRLSPSDLDRKRQLAEIYIEMEEHKKTALALFDEIVKAEKADTDLQIGIAQILEDHGCVEAASKVNLRLVRKNLGDPNLCNERAISLRKNGQYSLAEECYVSLVKVHPANPIIWYNRGINLGVWSVKSGREERILRREKAIECLERAVSLDHFFQAAKDALQKLSK